MNNAIKIDPFQDLYDTMVNGNYSVAQATLKSCSRSTRYQFIQWMKRESGSKQYSDRVIKWCVLGEWK